MAIVLPPLPPATKQPRILIALQVRCCNREGRFRAHALLRRVHLRRSRAAILRGNAASFCAALFFVYGSVQNGQCGVLALLRLPFQIVRAQAGGGAGERAVARSIAAALGRYIS